MLLNLLLEKPLSGMEVELESRVSFGGLKISGYISVLPALDVYIFGSL